MVSVPKGTVLLIEEDLRLQQYFAVTLRLAGYETRFARDAMEGFAALQTYHVDIIAINNRLPDMSSLQFLETLLLDKSYQNVRGVPVIVMTPSPIALHEKWRLFRMGVKAVFIKDNGFEEMVQLMQHEIDARRKVFPMRVPAQLKTMPASYLAYLDE